jgi:D-glycero-alpha-D-manno-heptose-7-phosphate kinase
MICSVSPLRMSFVGGGSDIPEFYSKNSGCVVSTSINKSIYILIKSRFEEGIRLSYSKTENASNYKEIEHMLVRSALGWYDFKHNLEIVSMADIPSSGTGLGSSSSFSVALINGLNTYYKIPKSLEELAESACKLEIEECSQPIGKQDQYAATYGGLRIYEFHKDGKVSNRKLKSSDSFKKTFDSQIMMFYLGSGRSASNILKKQIENLKFNDKEKSLIHMVNLSYEFANAYEAEDINELSKILNENWHEKKKLQSGISSSQIDDIYSFAIKHGALSGKLLGAGGGGFLMFFVPKNKQEHLKNALSKLRYFEIKPSDLGARIINMENIKYGE